MMHLECADRPRAGNLGAHNPAPPIRSALNIHQSQGPANLNSFGQHCSRLREHPRRPPQRASERGWGLLRSRGLPPHCCQSRSTHQELPVQIPGGRLTWRSFAVEWYGTLEWIDWFNYRRLFEAHGQVPPAEFEENYYRRQNGSGRLPETQTKQPA